METIALSGEARFELKRQLADTLQGRIYSAIDKRSGEWVVVKETWKQLVKLGKSRDGHTVPENFEDEKRILRYLSSQKDAHSGFVHIIDEWEDKDCFLMAMEMCRGGELFEFIKGTHSDGAVAHYTRQQARLPQLELDGSNEWIESVQRMFHQIVSCTAWLHSKGVCHLDMSLENAMIASRSKKLGHQIKIIDFGLAKYYANGKFTNNQRVGKTGYMAPEVFAKKQYDARAADIWSLGVMLFMMLIGAPPYQLPSPSNPAFNFIVNGRLKDVLKHWKRLRCVNKDALDLLNKIFKYEAKRITMDEILKHPFVNIHSAKHAEAATKAAPQQTPAEPLQPEPVPQPQPQQQQQQEAAPSSSQQQQQQQEQEQEQVQEQEQAEPVPKPKEAKQEQKVTPQDFENYSFRTEVAKKLLARLNTDDANRSTLTQIMREIEQKHKALGDKLRQNSNKGAGNMNSSNSSDKLQQTIKELHIINSMVEQRLANSNKPKATHHN